MSEQRDLFAQPVAPRPDRVTCWSMWQPYAGLVAAGLKTLETRMHAWPVKARPYPSTLLICATLQRDDGAASRLMPNVPDRHRFDLSLWRTGVALCLVDVIECRPLVADDYHASWYWDPGGDEAAHPGKVRYAWTLANLRRVAAFKVAGGQGFSRSMSEEEVERMGGVKP